MSVFTCQNVPIQNHIVISPRNSKTCRVKRTPSTGSLRQVRDALGHLGVARGHLDILDGARLHAVLASRALRLARALDRLALGREAVVRDAEGAVLILGLANIGRTNAAEGRRLAGAALARTSAATTAVGDLAVVAEVALLTVLTLLLSSLALLLTVLTLLPTVLALLLSGLTLTLATGLALLGILTLLLTGLLLTLLLASLLLTLLLTAVDLAIVHQATFVCALLATTLLLAATLLLSASLLSTLLSTLLSALLSTLLATLLLAALLLTTLLLTTLLLAILVVGTAVAVVVATLLATNGEANAVILSTTLSDGHEDGLMVGRGRHAAQAVVAGGETAGDLGREEATAVAGVVDALEKGKLLGVQRLLGVEGLARVLDSDVGVADDDALLVEVLRRRVVGVGGVGEGAGRKVEHLHLDIKVLLGSNVVAVLGVDEDARDHLGGGGNVSHGNTVAGSSADLGTVGQRLALAKVDKVVVGSRRSSLLVGARVVAIVGGAALHDVLGERQTTITTLATLIVVVAVATALVVAVAATSVLALAALATLAAIAVLTTLDGGMDWRAADIGSVDHHGCAREGCKKSFDLHVEGLLN